MQRRRFLMHAGALAGTAAFGQLGAIAASAGNAATAGDYKALLCIFLYGGNDTNNMVVPVDSAGYANYATLRSTIALPQGQLLPLAVSGGTAAYGLHPAMTGLQSLWNTGHMAIVANVGTLVQPLTRAQYLSTAAKPESLFSHIDQQHQWQASISDTSSSDTGWGGRLADQLASLNVNAMVPPMISTGGNNLFVTGAASQALVISVSCVGRRLVLGEHTDEELEAVRDVLPKAAVQIGFYSYGEISPAQPSGISDLHNQTMTVTIFSEMPPP